jgi:hypothetical protein
VASKICVELFPRKSGVIFRSVPILYDSEEDKKGNEIMFLTYGEQISKLILRLL